MDKRDKYHESYTSGPVQCQETDCDFTTHGLNLLRQHLVTKHRSKVETEQLNCADNNGKNIQLYNYVRYILYLTY